MFVLTIHGQKGGISKSLTCANLAVEALRSGLRVSLIDLDPQSTLMRWRDLREAPEPKVAAITPSRLSKAIDAAKAEGNDLCIIDTAAHSADSAIMAVEASDMLLIPCPPQTFDLQTLAITCRIAKLTAKPSYVVISQAPHAPSQIEAAIQVVKEEGLEVAPVIIHRRAPYAHATSLGLAACEYEPDGKAAQEIAALWNWLSTHVRQSARPAPRKSVGAHLRKYANAHIRKSA